MKFNTWGIQCALCTIPHICVSRHRTERLYLSFSFSSECDCRFDRRVFIPSSILTESVRLVSFICLCDAHYILASSLSSSSSSLCDAFIHSMCFVFWLHRRAVLSPNNFRKILLSQTISRQWFVLCKHRRTLATFESNTWSKSYARQIWTKLAHRVEVWNSKVLISVKCQSLIGQFSSNFVVNNNSKEKKPIIQFIAIANCYQQ